MLIRVINLMLPILLMRVIALKSFSRYRMATGTTKFTAKTFQMFSSAEIISTFKKLNENDKDFALNYLKVNLHMVFVAVLHDQCHFDVDGTPSI